jgi:O-glycosyl hydrolase
MAMSRSRADIYGYEPLVDSDHQSPTAITLPPILLALAAGCLLLLSAGEPPLAQARGAVSGSAVEVVQSPASLSQHLTRLRDLELVAPSDVCTPGMLRMAAGPKYTAGGEYERTIVFTNVTSRPCAIRGYPRVELLTADGKAVKPPVRHGADPLFRDFASFLVVLAPGAKASFTLGGRSSAGRGVVCQLAGAVVVRLPNSSSSLSVHARDPACSSGVFHSALGPGTNSASPSSSRRAVNVDTRIRYQRVTGVGAAMSDTSAWLIYDELSPAVRSRLMGELFGSSGIHLAFTVVPMGGSDFTATGQPYTYDDVPAGQADPALASFSITHDEAYLLPALRQMLAIDPQVRVFAAPWSAPAWMKANDALNDLGLLGTPLPADFRALAGYFVKFIQAYGSEGVSISAIAPANEPNAPAPYPSMSFPEPMEARWVAANLAPALAAAGLDPDIYGYDAVWESAGYAQQLISSPAGADLRGIAWHCYHGAPTIMSTIHDLAPSMDELVSECSPGLGPFPVTEVLIGAFRNWASAVMLWNLALDPSGGPVEPPNAGCVRCTGLVTIDETSHRAALLPSYYQLGQIGKFVEPGAWRVQSPGFVSYFQQPGPIPREHVTAGLDDVAFLNPDGSKVLLAYNTSWATIPFTVNWSGRSFTYALAPRATVTFRWSAR